MMNPWEFLLHFLPTHWPTQWQGSYSQADGGPSKPITVTTADHALDGGEPSIEFKFTNAGSTHTVRGVVVSLHGDASISLDGVQKTDHPVLNVGTAVHIPFSTFAIVHLTFIEGGQRHDYRFEGKVN